MTTVYIAGVFEFIENGATDKVTKYYEGNALRRSGYGTDDGVFYLLRDHLNSSSVILNQSGTVVTNGNQYYTPYGSNRGGTPFSPLTTKRFTGQYHENGLTQSEGLSYYGARWYDAKLGRFLSADSIVPGPANPQAFNRYSYVNNNPLRYVDPTGHWSEEQLTATLGQSWRFRYFGDLAPYRGAYAGNEKFLQFLTSPKTTNDFDLSMVGIAMGVGEFVSTLVGNTPDAIAIRGNFGAGAIIGVGNSFEAVVNFRSGELSYFWSPGASGGASGGAGGDIGIAIINDLPSNTAYRGYFGAVKADFKYGACGTIEGFLGLPLPNFPDGDIFAGANGAFLGVGLGGELDLSAGFSYAFEALRVNTNGREWGPDWRNYHPVADAGEILYQAYWGLGLLIYGDSWISANNNK